MRAIFSVCCARARDHAAKHGQVLPHAAPNKCCAATGARNPFPLMGSCTVDQRRSVQRQLYPPIAVAMASTPKMPVMCQTWPLPLLRSKPVAADEIDVGNCPVKMLRCQPVKVLHALGDPHHNWHLVALRETFERE